MALLKKTEDMMCVDKNILTCTNLDFYCIRLWFAERITGEKSDIKIICVKKMDNFIFEKLFALNNYIYI